MMQRQFSTFKLIEPTSAAAAAASSPSSSTDKVILDYLLYMTIQTRLKQADIELAPSSPSDKAIDPLDSACKTTEPAEKAALDSTVAAGILSSYHNNHYHPESTPFQQRLNLYFLSNHTLARYNALSNDHVIIRRRKLDKEHIIFATPIAPLSCRRHRRPACESCPARTSKKKSGLMDAIPIFLKTSADLLRGALDNSNNSNSTTSEQQQQAKPMVFDGQQVMGGGMPPTWYDLFLNLLTQAAIECYMCDGQTGPEPIFEIFSYGYVEDEDEPDEVDDDDETDNNDEDEDEDEDEEEETWNVKAADHHLLFPKTRTMYLFKTQVREREKEFLVVNKDDVVVGDALRQHFDKLARRYPLLEFEKSMHEFIHMVFKSMEVPALDRCGEADVASIVYRYPSDGSLLMPEVPDDESSVYSASDSSLPSSSTSSPPSSSSSTSSSSLAEEEAAAVTAIACVASISTGMKRAHPDEHVEQQVPRKKIAQ